MIEFSEHTNPKDIKFNVLIMDLLGPSLDKVFDPNETNEIDQNK